MTIDISKTCLAWMTKPQRLCYDLACAVWGGAHHLPRPDLIKPCSILGISFCTPKSLSTTNPDNLTRLVVLAHEEAIRVCISPGSGRYLRVEMHYCGRRDGSIWERHPTLAQAIEQMEPKN